MNQAINIILKLDKKTKKIRKKYDPYSSKFKPHITLVYPFQFKNQKALINHIKSSIRGIKPLIVSLDGIVESYPYVQLIAKRGKRELLMLRKKLNGKILKNVGEKKPLKYLPHMTIGIIEDKKKFKEGIKELKKLKPKFETMIKSIQLITMNKDMTIKLKRNFRLK